MRKGAGILYTLLIVLSGAVIAAAWYNLDAYLNADAEVVHSRNEVTLFRDTVVSVLRAEVRQRDYLLSHQSDDREMAIREISAAREQAQRLVSNGFGAPLDAMAANINRDLTRHLGLLEESLKRTDTGDWRGARELMSSREAAELWGRLRADGESFNSMVDERLRTRIEACHAAMMRMTQWVFAGLGALALATIAIIWLLRHHYSHEHDLNVALAAARDRAVQAGRDKDEFLGMLSHELRTPLTPALLTTEMLERQSAPDSDMQQDLSLVRQQLQIETRLIDDLLDVSRVLRGHVPLERAPLRLNEIIRTAAAQHATDIEAREQTLDAQLNATSDTMFGDADKLQKVFWHLISNASKFAPQRGHLVLSSQNNDGRFIVRIQDNGIGFTDDQRAAIFEPFKQVDGSLKRRYGGLGIGLALAKPIVELHGGTITAYSPGVDQGSTFTIDLPIAQSPNAPEVSRPTESLER